MKALQVQQFGSLDDLRVVDVPEAPLQAGDVRIEIEAAGVNPSDVGVALGRFPTATAPRILGRDFSGRIVDGPADAIGRAVWGSGGGELGLTRDGAHAEYLTIPAEAVANRPERLSAEQGAAMGVPLLS